MWRHGIARSFPPVYCLFFILIQLCTWKSIKSDRTSINGLVFMENNQSTLPLMNNNLVLIIKNETDHDDIYHLQHKINQDVFPVRFHSGNIIQIKKNGIYLLTLLIFGFTHRLLWEGIIVRQHLFTNHLNNITFIVRDVSNLPKCLLPGYPCLEGYGIPNQFISVCCSSTKCQSSITKQMTCGGNIPANHNVTITYILPRGTRPTIGLLNNKFVETTERMFQSISEACAIIKIVDATIHVESNNRSVFHNWFANRQFVLQFHVSIVTSESHNQCLTKTLHSIQTHSLSFAIPLQDGSSIVVPIRNPSVNIADVAEAVTTVEVISLLTTDSTTTGESSSVTSELLTTDSTTIAESSLVTSQLPTTDLIFTTESSSVTSELLTTDSTTIAESSLVTSHLPTTDWTTMAESSSVTSELLTTDSTTIAESSLVTSQHLTTDWTTMVESSSVTSELLTTDSTTIAESSLATPEPEVLMGWTQPDPYVPGPYVLGPYVPGPSVRGL